MYKNILLPLDASAMAKQALADTVAQAGHFHTELLLMKVLEPFARSISLPPGKTSRAEKVTIKLASEYSDGHQPTHWRSHLRQQTGSMTRIPKVSWLILIGVVLGALFLLHCPVGISNGIDVPG